jgi:multisubunit Na+/H+ antiporter MnhC subunit
MFLSLMLSIFLIISTIVIGLACLAVFIGSIIDPSNIDSDIWKE